MPTVELFTPYPKQKSFLDGFLASDKMFGVVVSPRGAGKTLLASNLMLYWALDKNKQKCAWVSPVFAQARSVFDEIVKAAGELIVSSNRMELIITLINNSTIKFLSADSPDSIRGYRFNYVVIDEAAFVKDLTIQQNILPTLNPNGRKCLMISTPKGKNHFFNYFNREDVYSMRFKLEDCPYINQEVVDSARTSLPLEIFRQEYEAQFVDSSNDVFTGVHKVAFVGEYREGGDVYIGVDTGLSDDASVLTCISPIGRVMKIVTLRNTDINNVATVFTKELRGYNVVGGNIEINGVGRGVYDLMQNKFRKVKGFTTNINNKTDMVRKLINDIETSTIELPSEELCPDLHKEFATYTYKLSPTGKLSFGHMSGAKDDHIDSLMLANYARVTFMERRPIRVSGIKTKDTPIRPAFGGVT